VRFDDLELLSVDNRLTTTAIVTGGNTPQLTLTLEIVVVHIQLAIEIDHVA
jgi:hypothetical protein